MELLGDYTAKALVLAIILAAGYLFTDEAPGPQQNVFLGFVANVFAKFSVRAFQNTHRTMAVAALRRGGLAAPEQLSRV